MKVHLVLFSLYGLCKKVGTTPMYLPFVNYQIKEAKYQNSNKLDEVYAFALIKICNDTRSKNLDENQEEFWKINNLDVVVSSKEQGFVEAIQNEILSNSFLIFEKFTEQELIKALKEKSNFNDDTIIALVDDVLIDKKMIVRKAIVDGQKIYEKSTEFYSILKEQNLTEEQVIAIESIFATDTNAYVKSVDNKKRKKESFH